MPAGGRAGLGREAGEKAGGEGLPGNPDRGGQPRSGGGEAAPEGSRLTLQVIDFPDAVREAHPQTPG